MLNKSKYIALICGVATIAVTVIFYLLAFDNIFIVPMRWVSLIFLALAEVIGTVKTFVKKTIFGVSHIVTSIAHIIIVLLLSIIFVNIFPLLIKKYVLFNLLALCILLAVDVVILFLANCVEMQNRKLSESQSVMGCCVEKAVSLCAEFNNTDYIKDLDEIVELLKYSDNSCLSQDEIAIARKLDEIRLLLKNEDRNIAEKIIEIKNAINLRSIKVANTKRGDY